MKQTSKAITTFLVISILALASLFAVYSTLSGRIIDNPQGIILFYGETCPHCKIVDAYISANKIEDKLTITHKEVFKNAKNAKEMELLAQSCNIDLNNLGVPFLYFEGKCYLGDKDIIAFLNSQVNSN